MQLEALGLTWHGLPMPEVSDHPISWTELRQAKVLQQLAGWEAAQKIQITAVIHAPRCYCEHHVGHVQHIRLWHVARTGPTLLPLIALDDRLSNAHMLLSVGRLSWLRQAAGSSHCAAICALGLQRD